MYKYKLSITTSFFNQQFMLTQETVKSQYLQYQNFLNQLFIINVKTGGAVPWSLSVFQDSGSGCCVGGGDGAWAAGGCVGGR